MRTKRNTAAKDVGEAIKDIEKHLNAEGTSLKLLLPSGCLLFNLACSDSPRGFMEEGTITNLIGDSDAGKTFLAMTIMACIFYKYGDKYAYDYYDYERAVSFSIAKLFGQPFADALNCIKIPPGSKGATIERWYVAIRNSCPAGSQPRIIVTDSFDALSCFAELNAMAKNEKKKEADQKGNFGTEKAKIASNRLNKLQQIIADNGSSLIIISQTRDIIGGFGFDKKTRSGGKALRFYSSLEVWLAKLFRLGSNPERPIGGVTQAIVKRSRITGKFRRCDFPILYAYGLDDTRASIMFLAEEGSFSNTHKPMSSANIVNMKDFGFKGKMKACVEWIEEDPKRKKALDKLVINTWRDIEEKTRLEAVGNRKPKFG